MGPGGLNRDDDKDKVSGLLAGAGHLETMKPDRDSLTKATRRFQKGASLKVDGLLNPGGPTIRALNSPGGKAPGLTPEAREVRAGLSLLGGEGRARSGRTADMLAGGDFGPMPEHLAGLWHFADNGKAEVVNLMDQLSKRSGVAAQRLGNEVAPRIPAAERGLFHASSVLSKLAAKDDDVPDEPPNEPDEPPEEPPKEPDDPPEEPPEDPPKEDSCLEIRDEIEGLEADLEDLQAQIEEIEQKIQEKEAIIENNEYRY